MTTIYISMTGIALVLLGLTLKFRGSESVLKTLKPAAFESLVFIPLLFIIFFIAKIVPELISKEVIGKFIGPDCGYKGIIIGSVAGMLTPGGPMVAFPLGAAFLSAGAAIPVLVSYIAGWGLLSVARIPFEYGFLGLKFTVIRIAATFILPVLAGILAKIFCRV